MAVAGRRCTRIRAGFDATADGRGHRHRTGFVVPRHADTITAFVPRQFRARGGCSDAGMCCAPDAAARSQLPPAELGGCGVLCRSAASRSWRHTRPSPRGARILAFCPMDLSLSACRCHTRCPAGAMSPALLHPQYCKHEHPCGTLQRPAFTTSLQS